MVENSEQLTCLPVITAMNDLSAVMLYRKQEQSDSVKQKATLQCNETMATRCAVRQAQFGNVTDYERILRVVLAKRKMRTRVMACSSA